MTPICAAGVALCSARAALLIIIYLVPMDLIAVSMIHEAVGRTPPLCRDDSEDADVYWMWPWLTPVARLLATSLCS